jgi:hypothetical protein
VGRNAGCKDIGAAVVGGQGQVGRRITSGTGRVVVRSKSGPTQGADATHRCAGVRRCDLGVTVRHLGRAASGRCCRRRATCAAARGPPVQVHLLFVGLRRPGSVRSPAVGPRGRELLPRRSSAGNRERLRSIPPVEGDRFSQRPRNTGRGNAARGVPRTVPRVRTCTRPGGVSSCAGRARGVRGPVPPPGYRLRGVTDVDQAKPTPPRDRCGLSALRPSPGRASRPHRGCDFPVLPVLT